MSWLHPHRRRFSLLFSSFSSIFTQFLSILFFSHNISIFQINLPKTKQFIMNKEPEELFPEIIPVLAEDSPEERPPSPSPSPEPLQEKLFLDDNIPAQILTKIIRKVSSNFEFFILKPLDPWFFFPFSGVRK